ncbi:arp2/3 complex subunit [Cystobasidiomycetes sp. EMM_F5]
MAARNWRTIDIDALDPEGQLTADELVDPDPRSPAVALDQARSKSQEARSALQRSDPSGALAAALVDAPYGSALAEASSLTLQTVLSVLNTVRANDISKVVTALDPSTQDQLMKYLYKGMASVEEGSNCSVLLNWHEKLTEVAGIGCIVRTMSDHRRA